MATKMRATGLAVVMALAMLAGVLLGGVLDVAHADGDAVSGTPKPWYVRTDDGTIHWAGTPEYEEILAERTAPADTPADTGAGTDAGVTEPEAVTCSLVDGCTINVVDETGVTVKVMHITFTDPDTGGGAAEVAIE